MKTLSGYASTGPRHEIYLKAGPDLWLHVARDYGPEPSASFRLYDKFGGWDSIQAIVSFTDPDGLALVDSMLDGRGTAPVLADWMEERNGSRYPYPVGAVAAALREAR